MRTSSFVVLGLGMLMALSDATAKDKSGKSKQEHMSPQEMAEMYQKLATPGAPQQQLAKLAGSWKTETKEWTTPGKPTSESSGTAEMKMLLGDRFLQQEYTGQMMGQPFSGLSITGYDNLTKKYMSTWMSTSGTGMFMMQGTGADDGKTITLKGEHPEPHGGKMRHRAVWKILDDDHQTYEMYGSHQGGKDMKMLEITYTRSK